MNDISSPISLDHTAIRRIILGVMVALLLGAMDQTIVAPALPTIGREFADLEQLPWVVTAYLLSSTAATPLYGKLSDIKGRRTMLLIAVAIFIAGSVLCALAWSLPTLIIARFIQGLGGGGLIAIPQTVVGDLVSPRERPRYQAYLATVFVTASIVGPIFGGFFAEHLHWSLIFWINLPLGAVALAMMWNDLRLLPQNHRPHQLDMIGAALMIVSTTLLLLGLSWGGVTYPWRSAVILGLLAASGLGWVLFALRLTRAKEPFIPLSVLFHPVVAVGVTASFFAVGAMVGLSIYVPIYFEELRGLTASLSGLGLMTMMTGTVVGAVISGRVMGKTPRYKRSPMIGMALATVVTAFLAYAAADLSLVAFEIFLAIIGIGIGTQFPVMTVSIQNAVAAHELGTATANLNFFRSLGSAVLVAAYGAIFFSTLGIGRDRMETPEALAEQVARAGGDLNAVFALVFAAAAVTLGIATLCIFAMKELPLRGHGEHPAHSGN